MFQIDCMIIILESVAPLLQYYRTEMYMVLNTIVLFPP